MSQHTLLSKLAKVVLLVAVISWLFVPTAQAVFPPPRSPFDDGLDRKFQGTPHKTIERTVGDSHGVLVNTDDFKLIDFATQPMQEVPQVYPQGEQAYLASKRAAQIESPQTPANVPAQIVGVPSLSNRSVSPLAPTPGGTSYEAIQDNGRPLDPSMAVGSSDLVVIVNFSWAVYDKSNLGNQLSRISFTNWFSDVVPAGTSIFDPRVIYDRWNSRFIISAVGEITSTQQSFWLISASQQSSAIGYWWVYRFNPQMNGSNPVVDWADRASIGVDGNNLFITSNMYDFAPNYLYAKIRAYRLSDLYAGTASQYTDAWNLLNADSSKAFTVEPADRYGSKGDMFFVNAASSGNLTLWRFTDPFGIPSLSSTNISVQAFSNPPNASQPGTTTLLNTVDDRILQAQYRGSGIWTTHHISYDFGSGPRSVVRLYEIKSDGSGLWNQITFGLPNDYLFYPSLATDTADDLVVSFSMSSSIDNIYPSILYTGRRFQDPSNTIQSTLAYAKVGEDYYLFGNPTPWGDYSGTALDPIDGLTVWMFNQYGKAGHNLSTWVANSTFFPIKLFLPLIMR